MAFTQQDYITTTIPQSVVNAARQAWSSGDKAVRRNNQRALRRMHGIPMKECLLVIAPYHFF